MDKLITYDTHFLEEEANGAGIGVVDHFICICGVPIVIAYIPLSLAAGAVHHQDQFYDGCKVNGCGRWIAMYRERVIYCI